MNAPGTLWPKTDTQNGIIMAQLKEFWTRIWLWFAPGKGKEFFKTWWLWHSSNCPYWAFSEFLLWVWSVQVPNLRRPHGLEQRFSNFFQVGTTFTSQDVLRTTLLAPFESKLFKILNYSVWYAIHVDFIFSFFYGLMFNLRGPQGQNPRTTCGPRTTVWKTLV
jgi:hypothetical protein